MTVSSDAKNLINVHFVLQGKGGCGKSVVASMLIQWLRSQDRHVQAIDLDPLNSTLSMFKGLDARHIDIMVDEVLHLHTMDQIVETMLGDPRSIVVDNGASTFVPVASYLLQNDIASVLQASGRRLVIHTVVIGGQLALETLQGLTALCQQFPAAVPIVVWVNEWNGPFQAGGGPFEETQAYRDCRGRIAAVIKLPYWRARGHGHDVRAMLDAHQTFDEAEADPKTFVVQKARLRQVRTQLFEQLDANLGVML